MNVIYIHSHDSGNFFSPYGFELPTFNLAKFAEEAIVFDNTFCVSPTCSPSRSALLTGKYPHENGMLGLTNRGFKLNDYNDHLVSILNRAGYHTVLCGIQHEAGRYQEHEFGAKTIGYKQNITQSNEHYEEKDLVHWDLANSEAIASYLQSHPKDKPFFLSFGMFSTHREYPDPTADILNSQVEIPAWLEQSDEIRRDFAGHLTSLTYYDRCFENVINALKNSGFYDNTLIVVTSDHGIAFPFAKCTLKDVGTKVIFMLKHPDHKIGRRYEHLVSHVDFVPTLLTMLDIKKPDEISGLDLSDSILNTDVPVREYVFSEVNFHTSYEPIRAVRSNRYKYIKYFDDSYQNVNVSNIDNSLTKTYYLNQGLANMKKEMTQLYDLKEDPYEMTNLIDDPSYREVAEEMHMQLLQWMRDTDDYLLNGLIDFHPNWKVNKPSAMDPKSKDPNDFI